MPIKALTFDIDDTLWDNTPVMAHVEPCHYDWLDAQTGLARRVSLEEYHQRRLAFAQAHPERRGDFTWIRQQVLYALLKEHGLEEARARALAERTVHYMLALRHQVTPFEEVEPMLDAFGQRYRMAVITNGNVDVRRLPLGRHFDAVFNAGEECMPKPDPRIFAKALDALGNIAPEDAIHIGDSWTEDALAAHAAGLQAVWIDVHNLQRECPAGIHRIRHVRELPALLAKITAKAE